MKKAWLLWSLIGLAVVTIALAFMMRGSGRSGLPTRSAFGANIELMNVKRIGPGAVELTLRANYRKGKKLGYRILLDEPQVLARENIPNNICIQYVEIPTPAGRPMKTIIRIAPGTEKFTIEQPVIRDAPEHHVTYEFRNVDARKLPITRKAGETKVILKQVHLNVQLNPNRWEDERGSKVQSSQRFSGIVAEEWLPGRFRQTNCRLRYEHGGHPDYGGRLNYTLPYPVRNTSFTTLTAIEKWNVTERIVRLVNPREGLRMHAQRVKRQTETFYENDICRGVVMHTFNGCGTKIKRFSFELSGVLPPHEDDKTTVRFEDVRVPEWRGNP